MSRKKTGPKRPDRVAPLVRQIVSEAMVSHSRDPLLSRVVITDVQMTPDVRIANIYFVALDESVGREELEQALDRSKGFLRSYLGQSVRMRHTPELRFRWDTGVEHGRRIEGILHELGLGEGDEAEEEEEA